jgi:hypothetical protein
MYTDIYSEPHSTTEREMAKGLDITPIEKLPRYYVYLVRKGLFGCFVIW